ncbi:type II toxin-antitoxin system HicA family toxin [Ralstonia flatus]|nr:type II toxin-antitoxin system HicA family toxin [Ralstonia sp. LMG 32965]MBN6209866.1 type II toxin-antitoxin system HicA family toxin [Ralstonia pickettii]
MVRITESPHHYKRRKKRGLVAVPHPKEDLPIGTVRSIQKATGPK